MSNNHGAHSAATPGPCDLSGITADKPSKGRGIPPAYSRELTLSQMRDLHPGASFTLDGAIIEATENGRTVRAETYREVHNQISVIVNRIQWAHL